MGDYIPEIIPVDQYNEQNRAMLDEPEAGVSWQSAKKTVTEWYKGQAKELAHVGELEYFQKS